MRSMHSCSDIFYNCALIGMQDQARDGITAIVWLGSWDFTDAVQPDVGCKHKQYMIAQIISAPGPTLNTSDSGL